MAVLPDTHTTSTTDRTEQGGRDTAGKKPEAPHTFTLVLKTSPPQHPPSHPKTPPSPEPATLSYEHDFALPRASVAASSSANANTQPHTLHLEWTDFKPVYRGREVPPSDPRYKPFDPQQIYELSVMCRSAFGKQEGEFGIVLAGIEGRVKATDGDAGSGTDGREGCWTGVQGWVRGWWVRERGVKL